MADPDPGGIQSLNAAVAAAAPAPAPSPPSGAPAGTATGLGPKVDLDQTRQDLAFRLLWVMIAVIAAIVFVSFIYSIRCWLDGGTCARASAALGILTGSLSPIFTAMVGLVGSVVGFYFGSKST